MITRKKKPVKQTTEEFEYFQSSKPVIEQIYREDILSSPEQAFVRSNVEAGEMLLRDDRRVFFGESQVRERFKFITHDWQHQQTKKGSMDV